MGPVFQVVHLDGVDPFTVALDVRFSETNGEKLRVWDDHRSTLALELGHRGLQRDEVRNGIRQPDREHVFSLLPVTGKDLATRHYMEIVVGKRRCLPLYFGQLHEMRGVDEYIDPPGLGPLDDRLVEYLYVSVDSRSITLVHDPAFRGGSISGSDSNGWQKGFITPTEITVVMAWACGIDGCGELFEDVEDLIVHQTSGHERRECKVCGAIVPDGYLAIRHAFNEHTRAEYVRAYDADSGDVREREEIKDEIEGTADLQSVVDRLNENDTL